MSKRLQVVLPDTETSMVSAGKAPSQTADVCPRNRTLPGAINDSYADESLSQKRSTGLAPRDSSLEFARSTDTSDTRVITRR